MNLEDCFVGKNAIFFSLACLFWFGLFGLFSR